jgi:hypothetical protein
VQQGELCLFHEYPTTFSKHYVGFVAIEQSDFVSLFEGAHSPGDGGLTDFQALCRLGKTQFFSQYHDCKL